MVDFEKRINTVAGRCRDLMELDCPEDLDRWAFDLASMERFKVVQVPELFGLADALSARETLMPVETQTVVKVVIETAE